MEEKGNVYLSEADLMILWKATAFNDFGSFQEQCEYILPWVNEWRDLFYVDEIKRALDLWEKRCKNEISSKKVVIKRLKLKAEKVEARVRNKVNSNTIDEF